MALPLLLGAAKGLIGSGKKKPKSGKEVAGKLVKRKEEQDTKKPSTQKKLAPTQVSGKKFFGSKSSTPKVKKLKPNTGNSQLDNVLQSIQSSVSKLAGTIGNFVRFKRKDGAEKTKRKNKMLARLREVGFGMVGGALFLGKKLLSKIPFFDRIKNFFVNILLGGLVLMILDNIKPIIETIKDVVKEVKKVFKLINKYLFQPMIEAGKFLIGTVLPIINDILKSPPVDFVITQIESLIKTIGDQFPKLEKLVEDLGNIEIPGKGLLKDFIGTDNSSGGAMGVTLSGTAADRVGNDVEFLQEVTRLSQKYQIKEGDLLALMASESGLDPRIVNPKSGATGLIQFTPATARGLGTTTSDLLGMTRAQQMKYVEKFFDQAKLPKGATAGQLYATVIAPAYASKDPSTPLYTRADGKKYIDNAPLDANNDGTITVGEMGGRLEEKKSEFGIADSGIRQQSPALRSPAQAGKSRVQTDIEEFRQFRTQFGYTSQRKPTFNAENLQIREMGTYGSGNYDISPLADDTNYEIEVHKGAGHHENRAFDIPVPSKAVGDKVSQFWKSKGYTTIWQSKGHYNHVHVEVPKNKAAEFFNIAPEQPKVTSPAERQTAEQISKQTDYEKMRTIFMPIAVPTRGSGDSGSGGGSPTIINSGSAKDTYLQIMMENKLFKQ
tara:strand:+ start:2083 stop:4074 length:1992 start_codon:yes stop_codon:yes gene_type:complete